MNTPLDNAITAAAAAEAVYSTDQDNVTAIKTAVDAAQAPLPAAQAKLSTDAQAFNDSLDALASAATAAKITVPSGS